jgi:hypothetical protein
MTRMIPETIHSSVESTAEKRMFEVIRDAPGIERWVCQACASAVNSYQRCLRKDDTFTAWTLEALTARIAAEGAGAWVDAFSSRYLRFDNLDPRLR